MTTLATSPLRLSLLSATLVAAAGSLRALTVQRDRLSFEFDFRTLRFTDVEIVDDLTTPVSLG